MRPLTADEKALSQAARKQVNKALSDRRKALWVRIRKTQPETQVRAKLMEELDHIQDVKGLPITVELDSERLTLDYEMLTRFSRKLKGRHVNMKIEHSVLVIVHHENLYGKNRGSIELYDLPRYQQELLSDLPVINLDF